MNISENKVLENISEFVVLVNFNVTLPLGYIETYCIIGKTVL